MQSQADPLGTPEVLAAELLEAFAAADAAAQGTGHTEWTIASFGGGAESGAGEDQAEVNSVPRQSQSATVQLPELESDGDDASDVGSELSLMQATPVGGQGTYNTPHVGSQTTPHDDQADTILIGAQRDGADFTFSAAPGVSRGPAYVSPVWGPLLRSAQAAPATGDTATSAPAADRGSRPVALQPTAGAAAANSSGSVATPDPQWPTAEQLLARLTALEASAAPAAIRQLRVAAEELPTDEAFAAHVAMAQILLSKKVPWLVRHRTVFTNAVLRTRHRHFRARLLPDMPCQARPCCHNKSSFPHTQAVESLKAALALRRDQRVLFRLGGVLFGLQQYSGALAAYQTALEARPLPCIFALEPLQHCRLQLPLRW